MIEVPIYIPQDEDGFLARTVAPHSAIVGKADAAADEDGRIVVYYEGNLYGAANMVTFADRAMFAYWRMRDNYPTVAVMAPRRSDLTRVATLYPEHGRVEVQDGLDLIRLARWITGEQLDSSDPEFDQAAARAIERTAPELSVSGVRVPFGGAR